MNARVRQWMPVGLLAGLLVAGMLAAAAGELDPEVSLTAAAEVWGDVVRDVDSFGMQVVRVRPEDEIALGDRLHERTALAKLESRADPVLAAYVRRLGESLAARVEGRGIPYRFHLLATNVVNAHAGPGGHIYVHEGLVAAVESEAELAAIIGHEIGHVEARHVTARFHYELALQRQGLAELGRLTDFLRRAWSRGYRQYQELEADALGLRLLAEAGYDPLAAPRAMRRIVGDARRERPAAGTPLDEAAGALIRELGRYGASHPVGEARVRRLTQQARRQVALLGPDARVYDGRRNLTERVTRAEQAYPEEEAPAPVAY